MLKDVECGRQRLVARFRCGSEERGRRYWMKEEERKCRICGEKEERWEHWINECKGIVWTENEREKMEWKVCMDEEANGSSVRIMERIKQCKDVAL